MNIYIMYEDTYFSIAVMIPLLLMLVISGTYLECVVFLWIVIRWTFLGKYIISLFDYERLIWIQEVILEKVFLKNDLNFSM